MHARKAGVLGTLTGAVITSGFFYLLLSLGAHRSAPQHRTGNDGPWAAGRRLAPDGQAASSSALAADSSDPGGRHGGLGTYQTGAAGASAAGLGHRERNALGLPGSAGCGGASVELVVGVLASPTHRSIDARSVIRETWMRFPVRPAGAVTVRFLLALNASGRVPDAMRSEAATHGDMVFLDTLDAYRNLVRKVSLFFAWAEASCPRSARVFKTDDDSFVRLDRLLELSRTLPATRLYYGSFLRKMPARFRDKKTQRLLAGSPLEGNVQNLPEWPWYASGGGYMLSGDVVAVLARPPLPLWRQTAEDRAVGIALFGYNVSYVSAGNTLRPWGTCHPEALLLHYQRDPGLLRRRYQRAVDGASICGEGWRQNQLCAMVDQGKDEVLACRDSGAVITKVIYADLGRHRLATGYKGPCSEGPSALAPEPQCTYTGEPTVAAAVEAICVGNATCRVRHDLRTLGLRDPCPGQFKRILVAVECGDSARDGNHHR